MTSSFLVSLVFWTLLSSNIARQPNLNEQLLLIFDHSLNAVIVSLEILLVWIQPSWRDCWAPILTAFLYVCYIWVLHYSPLGLFWPYPLFPYFIDPLGQPVWITFVALLVGAILVALIHCGLFLGLVRLRNWAWKKHIERTQRGRWP